MCALRHTRLPALGLVALLALAPVPLAAAPSTQEPPLDFDTLAFLTYPSPYTASGEVMLFANEFEDSDNAIFVTLVDEATAWGDLDSDSDDDAVVVLATNTGGSGVFYDLIAVTNRSGRPVPGALTTLGDRVSINSIIISDGAVTVDMITQGPDEPMCCGTLNVVRTYQVQRGEFILISEAQPGISSSGLPADWLDDVALAIDYASMGWEGSQVITLDGGEYDNGDEADRLIVSLTEARAAGDLDSDGDSDMVAAVAVSTGGSGVFVDLHAFLNEEGDPVWVASTPMGDRPVINALSIEYTDIIVDFLTHTDYDPMCCPTLRLVRTYWLEDEEILLDFEEQVVAPPPSVYELGGRAGALEVDAPPSTALIYAGGGRGLWLDPTLVSIHSGVPTGETRVDGAEVGDYCPGVYSSNPDVVLEWKEDGDTTVLRFFTVSNGDPAMIVVTPSGEVLCNDDMVPGVPDPLIAVEEPAAGRYAIFVGTYTDSEPTPGLLVITSQDLGPNTLEIGAMIPRLVE